MSYEETMAGLDQCRILADKLLLDLRRSNVRRDALLGVVDDLLEFLDDQADVYDGDYGEQRPNRAMSLATMLRVAAGMEP